MRSTTAVAFISLLTLIAASAVIAQTVKPVTKGVMVNPRKQIDTQAVTPGAFDQSLRMATDLDARPAALSGWTGLKVAGHVSMAPTTSMPMAILAQDGKLYAAALGGDLKPHPWKSFGNDMAGPVECDTGVTKDGRQLILCTGLGGDGSFQQFRYFVSTKNAANVAWAGRVAMTQPDGTQGGTPALIQPPFSISYSPQILDWQLRLGQWKDTVFYSRFGRMDVPVGGNKGVAYGITDWTMTKPLFLRAPSCRQNVCVAVLSSRVRFFAFSAATPDQSTALDQSPDAPESFTSRAGVARNGTGQTLVLVAGKSGKLWKTVHDGAAKTFSPWQVAGEGFKADAAPSCVWSGTEFYCAAESVEGGAYARKFDASGKAL